MSFPFSFSPLPQDQNKAIKEQFLGYQDGLVTSRSEDGLARERGEVEGLCLGPETAKQCPKFYSMNVRSSDIWVITFPKSGTTWTQEMAWQVANKVDFEEGKVLLHDRFPYLEMDSFVKPERHLKGIKGYLTRKMISSYTWFSSFEASRPSTWLGFTTKLEELENFPLDRRRFIKSHVPFSFLPPDLLDTAKVIYVARNPKDTMVSYYHHHKLFRAHGYGGDLTNFAEMFMNDQLMYSPYWGHIKEAWGLRHHPNLLFIFYEDMIRDLKTVVEKVCEFLDTTLDDDQVTQLLSHLHLSNFKNNPAVNLEIGKDVGLMNSNGHFIRKGLVGGWREDFNDFPELAEIFDQWVNINLNNTDLVFPK